MDNHTLDAAAQRQSGQTFLARVQKEAAPALLAARNAGRGWQEMHRAAAAHGLVVRLRGAGLVIGHAQDRRLHVKASDVDRGLSLKALSDALGSFEPPQQNALQVAFKLERETAERARVAATAALRERHRTYAAELAAYYRARMKGERATGLRGHLRRDSFQHVADQRRQDHAARITREAEERRQVREAHRAPNWQTWLEAKAASGDKEAAEALGSRRPQATRSDTQPSPAPERASARKRERDTNKDLER